MTMMVRMMVVSRYSACWLKHLLARIVLHNVLIHVTIAHMEHDVQAPPELYEHHLMPINIHQDGFHVMYMIQLPGIPCTSLKM